MNRQQLTALLDLLDNETTVTITTAPLLGPVFVRTVTHYYTGRCIGVQNGFLVLEDAAWIADTGRFSTALTTGALNEVEPFPAGVLVNLGAIVDVCRWDHDLPRAVK